MNARFRSITENARSQTAPTDDDTQAFLSNADNWNQFTRSQRKLSGFGAARAVPNFSQD
jgi:hypothetical protein